MMSTSCRSLESLHYLDSWNRHCGGDWWTFASRSLAIGDASVLAFASGRMMWASRFFGLALGSALLTKSMNDIYESWTGDRGIVREMMGDLAYDETGYAVVGYGLFRQVPKIGYLGNPKKDFFTKDPLSYEPAFKQYARYEFFHLAASEMVNGYNNIEKYEQDLCLEDSWSRHLLRCQNYGD